VDDQQSQQGDALLGVEAYVVELFGELPEDEHKKRVRQLNYQLKKGQLPGRKMGRFWIGSRRVVRQFIAAKDAEGAQSSA
jgi:hypothetical protein